MKYLLLGTLLSLAWLGETGDGNVVIGNGNRMKGNGNLVRGNGDDINGNQNVQIGDYSRIIGNDNFNQGNNQQIVGDNHYFVDQATTMNSAPINQGEFPNVMIQQMELPINAMRIQPTSEIMQESQPFANTFQVPSQVGQFFPQQAQFYQNKFSFSQP